MKKVIRSNCFETNSSSMHAIVVNPNAKLIVPNTHVIAFTLGEYGWEFSTYRSVDDRASYLWTAILKNYVQYDLTEEDRYYTKEARDWVDYINKAVYNRFKGNVETYFQWPDSHTCFFYVDHERELKPWLEYLKEDENNLLTFLLGSDSEIRTGNDNDDYSYIDTSCPDGWYMYRK